MLGLSNIAESVQEPESVVQPFDSVISEVTFKPNSHWVSPKSKLAIDEVVDVLLVFPEARNLLWRLRCRRTHRPHW